MKIALGTVQFGMKYGVANTGSRVGSAEVQEILGAARAAGIDTLDTAAAYGNSEQVLGQIGVDSFNIVSKVPPQTENTAGSSDWILRSVEQSLINLKTDCLYGLLLHRPLELLHANGGEMYKTLLSLKEQGLVEKIGASIYGPSDLDKLAENFDFDIVQAPMNILDRRLESTGWLNKLSNCGTEIHIRSAFLQGLLLMPLDQRPDYFKPWQALLADFDAWVEGNNCSPIQACLSYLNQYPEITRIVVGVETEEQLWGVISAMNSPMAFVPENLQTNDLNLINPACWKL